MRLLLAVLLLAGCAGKLEAKKWRAAKRVFVAVDTRTPNKTKTAVPEQFLLVVKPG